jgi:hypothetical protein
VLCRLCLLSKRVGNEVYQNSTTQPKIIDTTDTAMSTSGLDIHLDIESEGRERTKLSDKRDDLNDPIVNFTFICSNIPAEPAYGVYISQVIRYSRVWGSNHNLAGGLQ